MMLVQLPSFHGNWQRDAGRPALHHHPFHFQVGFLNPPVHHLQPEPLLLVIVQLLHGNRLPKFRFHGDGLVDAWKAEAAEVGVRGGGRDVDECGPDATFSKPVNPLNTVDSKKTNLFDETLFCYLLTKKII